MTYIMTVIGGVFCLKRAFDTQTRNGFQVQPPILDLSKIMGGYNTADNVVRDKRTNQL